MVAADDYEHPLVTESHDLVEEEFLPVYMGSLVKLLGTSCTRYACTVAATGCLVKHLLGRRPSLVSALVGPGLFFGVGLIAECATRCIASRILQWHAAAMQKRALLTDVTRDFALVVPHEMEREERILGAKVWVVKASYGVTPMWFRRLHQRGWTWTIDLRHWQSVQHHRWSVGGMGEGQLPVRSNRWLLRRLHMRDVRDRVRPPRAVLSPPPLSLPAHLVDEEGAPADFLCPIARTVMTDPVVGPAGVSYERAALLQWLSLRKTDPSTQGPLERHDLYANLNLRGMIAAWAHAHPRSLAGEECQDCPQGESVSGGECETTPNPFQPTEPAQQGRPKNPKRKGLRNR